MNGETPDEHCNPMDLYGLPPPEITQEEITRLYHQAAREGIHTGFSLNKFLALSSRDQMAVLRQSYGGDGGTGYDNTKFIPSE